MYELTLRLRPSPTLQRRNKGALRVNPEQAPAFKPERAEGLIFTRQADSDLREMEDDPSKKNILKAVRKTLGFMETNLRHPSLNTHEFTPLESPAIYGEDSTDRISIPYRKGGVKASSFLTGFTSLKGPNGEKLFEAYVQQRMPAAYRIFWYYGPGRNQITIVAITPHP